MRIVKVSRENESLGGERGRERGRELHHLTFRLLADQRYTELPKATERKFVELQSTRFK